MKTVLSRDGTTIAYDQSGSGAPVILVGGAFQQRIDRMLQPLAKLLAPRFTVITYDRRGRGDSTDTAPYAIARETEDIAALIEVAGGTASLFGMSSGAILALDAAQQLPITKLALYEPPLIIDDSRAPLPRDFAAHLRELIAAGQRDEAVAYFMTTGVEIPPEMVEQIRQSPMWAPMKAIAPTLVYDATIVQDVSQGTPLPTDRWANVTMPVLAIDSGASPAFMHHGAQALADLLPHGARRTLPDQTHDVDPTLLAPALIEFFAS